MTWSSTASLPTPSASLKVFNKGGRRSAAFSPSFLAKQTTISLSKLVGGETCESSFSAHASSKIFLLKMREVASGATPHALKGFISTILRMESSHNFASTLNITRTSGGRGRCRAITSRANVLNFCACCLGGAKRRVKTSKVFVMYRDKKFSPVELASVVLHGLLDPIVVPLVNACDEY